MRSPPSQIVVGPTIILLIEHTIHVVWSIIHMRERLRIYL